LQTGIYGIVNLVNWKIYIGKTKNIRKRWGGHRNKLERKTHDNEHFQNAWYKYGGDNFKVVIIEECLDEELIEKEIFYISFYSTANREFGYNMTTGGDGIPGHRHTDETKIKISNSQKGRVQSKEQIQKRKITIENWTDEEKEIARINSSNGHKGQVVSQEQREKLSKLYKGKPSKRINYVTKEETKLKISIAMTGKTKTEESKQKQRETIKNKTEEEKKESRKRMSESAKKRGITNSLEKYWIERRAINENQK